MTVVCCLEVRLQHYILSSFRSLPSLLLPAEVKGGWGSMRESSFESLNHYAPRSAKLRHIAQPYHSEAIADIKRPTYVAPNSSSQAVRAMSHPLCIRCHPTDGSDVLNSSTADANYLWYDISAPTEGDIYQLEQTVTQPIHHILRGRPLPRQLTLTSPAPTASFTTAKSGWLKRRPCLIEAILEETEGPGFARIYAMATYGGTTIDDMADIYHHFSVGVAPGAVDPTHIHTVPEWRGKEGLCQWIIAYPYSIPIADVMKGTRWTLAGMADAAPRSHCRVTPPMRAYLRRLSAIKETEWQKRCQDDKGLRRRMLKEAFQARRTVGLLF